MKPRDLLAVPFWSLAQLLNYVAVTIGGEWTARMFREQAIIIGKILEEDTNGTK